MKKIKIVAIDDHQFTLDAFRANTFHHPDIEIVGEGRCGDELMPLLEEHNPDILLLDQRMPQTEGISYNEKPFRPLPSIEKVRRLFPDVRIIIISAWHESFMVRRTLEAGCSGYLSKSDAHITDLGEAIHAVMHSELFLSKSATEAYMKDSIPNFGFTARMTEAVQLVADNTTATNAQLAEMMGVSESTFNKHLTQAMKRTGTPKNRLATVTICKLMGII